ncbi:hypothetical protein ALC62_04603 [Cyphomyrmex costatus]|uniref:Uncharacterized protein n=1 Tax=Cyphomyrmex costatus TaxID=456900 RepID=A0A195CVB3_9HYME|nr:hypothetical protein ALC62_04603 [Cyphomyrmex costatus]
MQHDKNLLRNGIYREDDGDGFGFRYFPLSSMRVSSLVNGNLSLTPHRRSEAGVNDEVQNRRNFSMRCLSTGNFQVAHVLEPVRSHGEDLDVASFRLLHLKYASPLSSMLQFNFGRPAIGGGHCKPPSFNLLRAAVYHPPIRFRWERGLITTKTPRVPTICTVGRLESPSNQQSHANSQIAGGRGAVPRAVLHSGPIKFQQLPVQAGLPPRGENRLVLQSNGAHGLASDASVDNNPLLPDKLRAFITNDGRLTMSPTTHNLGVPWYKELAIVEVDRSRRSTIRDRWTAIPEKSLHGRCPKISKFVMGQLCQCTSSSRQDLEVTESCQALDGRCGAISPNKPAGILCRQKVSQERNRLSKQEVDLPAIVALPLMPA